MNDIFFENDRVIIKNVENFNLSMTLDCGQAFRWRVDENGVWSGVAGGKYLELYEKDGNIILSGTNEKDFNGFWKSYFDLDRNYSEIIKHISVNETVKTAAEFSSGIRVLNQDSFEALCSFIISQNNNIPRIKGIIDRLCENFGEKCKNSYTFPDALTLSRLTEEDLSVLRCGFRARYILDAAKKVSSGEIDLNSLKSLDFETARKKLMTITGVGPKVADCTLLFGLGHIEAFPQDVWIKRAMRDMFDGVLPECAVSYAGIVQQYIFYYTRENANK